MVRGLILSPSGSKYTLVQDYHYKDVLIPANFTTDGISYKLRFLGLFINRFDPRYIEAAVVHDYLTDLGEWEKGNKYFEELLPHGIKAKFMVMGVKIYKEIKGY